MSGASRPLEGESPIVLTLESKPGEVRSKGFWHRIAGFDVWSPVPLTPWALPGARPEARVRPIETAWSVDHDGTGFDLGELRRVVALHGSGGEHRFDYDDGECFVIDPEGRWIEQRRANSDDAESNRSLDRALGAPLIVALAIRGVHVLHASAIVRDGGVIALTAAPGVGKSTLAAAAERSARVGWRRIADDLLPVRLAGEPEALPHFPQGKLSASEQYPADRSERVPLRALVILERQSVDARLQIDRLDSARAAIAFAEATVAARWFDQELMARHLAACAVAAGTVRVARMSYPGDLERLETILLALARELG